jgi:hypothetical protein
MPEGADGRPPYPERGVCQESDQARYSWSVAQTSQRLGHALANQIFLAGQGLEQRFGIDFTGMSQCIGAAAWRWGGPCSVSKSTAIAFGRPAWTKANWHTNDKGGISQRILQRFQGHGQRSSRRGRPPASTGF